MNTIKSLPGAGWRGLRRRVDLLAAFLLPAAVYTAILSDRRIYPFAPGGKYTVLTSDLDNQYAQFYSYFDQAMSGHGSLLFTWRGDLGMNFWPIVSYYLTSPFGFLTMIGSNRRLPIMIAIITILKIGTAGWSMALLLRRYRKTEGVGAARASSVMTVVLASAYALAAWTIVYAFNIMWLDALFLLPLALIGVEKLLQDGRIAGLAAAVGLNLVIDFYTGAMICVFACLYALARYFGYRAVFDRRDFLRTALRFAAAGAIGGMLAAAFIIPTYLGGLTQKTKLHADASVNPPVPVLSILIRFLGGTVDTGAKSPNLAAGTLVLLLVPVFFAAGKIKKAERIAFGGVLAFLLAATEIKPLYVIMHGGQMPNAFPFRFAFLITGLLVILAFRGWLAADSMKQVYAVLISGAVWFGILYLGRKSYPRILSGEVTRFDTAVLILGTAVLAFALWLRVRDTEKPLPRGVPRRLATPLGASLAVVALFALDASGSAYLIGKRLLGVPSTAQSWAQWYNRPASSYGQALQDYTPDNNEFFRTEGYDQNLRTSNDAMRYGNFAQTHFSSLSSGTLHQIERDLGFAHHEANVWAAHAGATILTDGLFGFKYLVTTTRTDPAADIGRLGVTLVRTYDNSLPGLPPDITKVWRIDDAVPVGFRLTASDLAHFQAPLPQDDPYAAQEQVFGMPGAYQPLCQDPVVTGAGLSSTTNPDGSLTIVSAGQKTDKKTYTGSITWTCDSPGTREAYIYAPEGLGIDQTFTRVDGQGRPGPDPTVKQASDDLSNIRYPYAFSNGFQDLGGVKAGAFTVTMTSTVISSGKTMHIMANAVRGLDPVAADATLSRFAAAGVSDVHWTYRGLTATTTGDQASTVYFSIPAIPGWGVKVDGKDVAATKLLGGTFLGIPVGPGTHTIALEFTPPGLYAGIGASVLGLIILVAVWLFQRARREPEFGERVRKLSQSTVVKYLFAGGAAFVTDLGTLFLCHGLLGWPVWLATALAYGTAWFVNFGLNRVLTFAEQGAREGKVHKQSIRFTILVLVNLVITELMMAGLIHVGVDYLIAKVLSSIFITLYNFEVYKRWVFAGDKTPTLEASLVEELVAAAGTSEPETPDTPDTPEGGSDKDVLVP